ncbi:NAD(P)-binding protein [Coprinellus micaceus]|uniref:NAD(P)-binding protein n=1 Tax=Coprinellus micaceus TaxID=71717 RepID=A0A4Y7TEP8_COPMI|nr:NAD(P)-binding protein [Coprinellus micaceus]
MKKSVWRAIQDQWSTIPPVANADLTGQTVVVVGATTGIGFEAAKHFGRMGPTKPILACRNEEKGRAAASRIQEETGFERTEVRYIDLARFASVRAFADTFENESRLDILVMNAGIIALGARKESVDGWEEVLQVKDLSTSLT